MKARHSLAAAALVAVATLAGPAMAEVNVRTDLDLGELAQCVSDSGAKFYGAHWCPVCLRQNKAFGEHSGDLPYVECYDGSRSEGMNETCRQAGIRSFPTWVLEDGRVASRLLSPAELAAATGCLGS